MLKSFPIYQFIFQNERNNETMMHNLYNLKREYRPLDSNRSHTKKSKKNAYIVYYTRIHISILINPVPG
jgi:hypothetical protein